MGESIYRVMTYNIHGGLDAGHRPSLPGLSRTIGASRAGLIGLQEVECCFRRRSGFADQPALIAARLNLDCRFAAAIDRAPLTSRGKFGNAVLSCWPILHAWQRFLPSQGERRVLLGAQVQGPSGCLTLSTCHLGLDRRERELQVEEVVRAIESLTGPFLLCGDFNALPGAPELAPLFDRWREVQTARGMNLPTFPPGGARIDFIFVSPHWEILTATVMDSPASDHLPLVAELALP